MLQQHQVQLLKQMKVSWKNMFLKWSEKVATWFLIYLPQRPTVQRGIQAVLQRMVTAMLSKLFLLKVMEIAEVRSVKFKFTFGILIKYFYSILWWSFFLFPLDLRGIFDNTSIQLQSTLFMWATPHFPFQRSHNKQWRQVLSARALQTQEMFPGVQTPKALLSWPLCVWWKTMFLPPLQQVAI